MMQMLRIKNFIVLARQRCLRLSGLLDTLRRWQSKSTTIMLMRNSWYVNNLGFAVYIYCLCCTAAYDVLPCLLGALSCYACSSLLWLLLLLPGAK